METLKVTIEGSGRHVHVTREHLDTLFGEGFQLENIKPLSQPGEFASNSKVDLIGPKGTLKGVSIIGPCRKVTQIELSYSDARVLGVNPPLRESGDIAGSAPVTIVGPNGTLELQEGVIIAKRHLHMTDVDGAKYGIKDKEIVQIKTEGPRALIFDQVVARVSSKYATYVHIDYDEINAAGLFSDMTGTVIKKQK
jgi:putative phosphotransacetylase